MVNKCDTSSTSCNGDTYVNCVNQFGESYCNDNCLINSNITNCNISNTKTIKGCNGDTYDNCVKNNGEAWCNRYCTNADIKSTCNGDTYVNRYLSNINDIDGTRRYCKDKKNNLYNLTTRGCNGDTYENCVKNNGTEWCNINCVNADPDSTCNGAKYKDINATEGISWAKANCTDKKGKLYELTKTISNFTNTSKYNSFNNIIIFIVMICIIYLLFNNKNIINY